MMVGYGVSSAAGTHLLYNIKTKMVFFSRDVVWRDFKDTDKSNYTYIFGY